jgi:hypothetical protein
VPFFALLVDTLQDEEPLAPCDSLSSLPYADFFLALALRKEITDIDETKIIEGQELVENIWRNRMNPKEGLKPVLNEDGSELELGVKGFVKYSKQSAGLLPEALAHAVIDATPQQVMGLFADSRKDTKLSTREVIESTYTTALEYRHVPVSVATVSDRDFLFRTAHKKIEEGVYVSVSYVRERSERKKELAAAARQQTTPTNDANN